MTHRTSTKAIEDTCVTALKLSHFDEATVRHLSLGPEQEQFVDPIEQVFSEFRSSSGPELKHPFAIVARNDIVGFFVLREKTAVPEWAPQGVITLHSFRVGPIYQGNGFGTAAIRLATQWILANRPCVDILMLAVNARNATARKLYLKSGFRDTGTTYLGPVGIQNILEYRMR